MLVLFTDTDTDMTLDEAKKLGFKLISMPYSIDGENFYPYESWEEFDEHGFYEKLRGGVVPKTSSISEERYLAYFEPILKNGDDIFYAHFTRSMSKTFESMDRAIEKLREKYPERKIYTVDTMAISLASLNIIKEMKDLFDAGKTPEEVINWTRQEAGHFAFYFFADGVKFFRQSGRISGLSGAMGSLLGIRPIVHMDNAGKLLSIGKEKGRFKAVEKLVEYVEKLGKDIEKHRIIIGSADNRELVVEVTKLLEDRFGKNLNIEIVPVNPTIGAHCGPDAVGISFYAVHR